MSEDRNYHVTLKTKGLEVFIPESVAQEMYRKKSTRRLAIIEIAGEEWREFKNGGHRLMTALETMELIPEEHEERFRGIIRMLWEGREDEKGQPALPLSEDAKQERDATLNAAAEEVEESHKDAQSDEKGNVEAEGEWDGNTEEEQPDNVKEIAFSGKK